jgi:hypothetical protein
MLPRLRNLFVVHHRVTATCAKISLLSSGPAWSYQRFLYFMPFDHGAGSTRPSGWNRRTTLWVPSQNGFSELWPQRHKAMVFRLREMTFPSTSTSCISPRTRMGPFG